jgi:glycosyltransferase involved in cell wall biosynthesis
MTWGLLGPGKGIERVIAALPLLQHIEPGVSLTIVGETHPNVLLNEGSRYRDRLRDMARELGVEESVSFVAGYQSEAALHRLASSADVVAITYDNDQQVSSGVLTEALSLGRPVVATDFPHARELLTSGAGIIVGRDDPSHLARAIERLLTDERSYRVAAFEGQRKASRMGWSSVARSYAKIIDDVRGKVAQPV